MSWVKRTLGEIYDDEKGSVQTGPFGSQLHESDYKETGNPVIMPKDIINDKLEIQNIARINGQDTLRLSRHIVKKDDIVFPRRGDIGKRVLITEKEEGFLCGTGCLRLRGTGEVISPQFLFLYLKQPKIVKWIENQAIGATMLNLNTSILRSVPVKYPPLPTQQKIASILSAYDDLIENNNLRIKLLEEMAEEIYKEWFVRLRFPDYENVNVVNGVPEGWEKSRLENHLEYFRGKSYSSAELRDNEGLAMLNLKNINRGGGFRRDGLKYFEGRYNEANIASSGDIIMAVTDMTQEREIVGRVAIVPEMGIDKFITSMDLIRIEPIDLPKTFLYALLRYSGIGLKFKEFANGVNVLHLTPDLIKTQRALIPSNEVCLKFTELVQPMISEIDLLANKNQLLQQTRDLLLPRLICGKLSVEDITP